jgi:hypothetical protein
MASIADLLPPSLNLSPHLSAHKYFFVCTLTVAAWDTLVLSPRTWRLFKTKEWPILKILFHFLRVFMPVEFTIVAVAFFDTKFTQSQCNQFYLFEPICTAILVSVCSLVHTVRVTAIYAGNKTVQVGLYVLLGLQVIAMGVMCGFYRPMPLEFPAPPFNSGQGCIAGPKFNDREFVGVYWLIPTIFFTSTFVLALTRSLQSLGVKQLSYWKLMLRDGLNLYGAIFIVNMVNMLFWFIAKPTDQADTIKTIVTSMSAVLTTTMTLRIILSIRGPLAHGGSFNGGQSTHATGSHTHSNSRSAHTGPHVLSSHRGTNPVIAINPHAHSRPGMGMDAKEPWQVDDDKSQTSQYKEGVVGYPDDPIDPAYGGGGPRGPKAAGYGGGKGGQGVQVHIERQTHNDDYGGRPY